MINILLKNDQHPLKNDQHLLKNDQNSLKNDQNPLKNDQHPLKSDPTFQRMLISCAHFCACRVFSCVRVNVANWRSSAAPAAAGAPAVGAGDFFLFLVAFLLLHLCVQLRP